MTKMASIQADLNKLVKQAAAVKADALRAKTASIGDDAKDGTKPATTGEQAAANAAASKDRVEAAMVDGAAKDNASGKSLESHNSDGVAAVATDGQTGAKGAVLDKSKTEPLTSTDVFKTASDLVAQLRKAAESKNPADGSLDNNPSEGVAAVATDGQAGAKGSKLPVKDTEGAKGGKEADKAIAQVEGKTAEAKTAEAKTAEAKPAEKTEAKTAAAEKPVGIRGFLAKVAMSVPQIKTAAESEGMDEGQVGDAAAEDLLQKLESGQVSEEEAQQILQEAIASGAISEEDVTAALAEAQAGGAPGAAAPAGDPAAAAAGAPPAGDPAAAAGGIPPEAMVADQAKMASVSPEHPFYLQKLAMLHADMIDVGYQFGLKLAAELKSEHEKAETPAEEKAEHTLEAKTDEEKAALAQAQKELGLSNEDVEALAKAPVKTASLVDKYRAAILNKVAAINAAK
jgi:hypothetical protein